MKKVSLFVVGNSKSGTSALCDYLDQHPDLCLSNPKEPNYFATDFTHEFPEGAFKRMSADAYHDCYDSIDDKTVRVDGSACYLFSKTAAQNIATYNPDARIVAVFREPVDFLYSYHLQMLRNVAAEGEVIATFEDALAAEPKRKDGKRIPAGCRVPAMLYYRERVKYAEQLRRYYELFPAENIRVYLYDDFRADNFAVATDVYDLAGVNPSFAPSLTEVNQASRTRSPRIARIVHELAHGSGSFAGIHRAITAVAPQGLRKKVLRSVTSKIATSEKGAVAPKTKQALKAEFRSEVEAFGRLIGKDLVRIWGYDADGREV